MNNYTVLSTLDLLLYLNIILNDTLQFKTREHNITVEGTYLLQQRLQMLQQRQQQMTHLCQQTTSFEHGATVTHYNHMLAFSLGILMTVQSTKKCINA